MKNRRTIIATAIGVAASFAAVESSAADSINPFGLSELGTSSLQFAEAKCGEGRCGGSKQKGGKPISVLEGKCGEGKCGTVAVRRQMDVNRDGLINRAEYMDWAAKMAGANFDSMDQNKDGDVDYDEFFEHFQTGGL